ncbi:MAG: hypothetical protein M1827_003703 [Pycnora praestabilis]|nr:MAG: hypothetical protein M1827_003703 [Pycnora praestabilis]
MDSMRSLNTSLPQSPKPSEAQPPEQLFQVFSSAALSVTKLFKKAVADQDQARQSGYQEALDDVLTFLDKESLGLGDGEGWRVRQWATERLDGTARGQTGSDSDEEEKRARSSSPVAPRKPSPELEHNHQPTRSASPTRPESAPPSTEAPILIPEQYAENFARSDAFSFRSPYPYPQQHDTEMEVTDRDLPNNETQTQNQSQASNTSTPSVRLEVVPRPTRTGNRHGGHSSKGNNRSSTSLGSLAAGSGFKRRLPFGEFFDISSFGNGKDGHGPGSGAGGTGSKRGRFT